MEALTRLLIRICMWKEARNGENWWMIRSRWQQIVKAETERVFLPIEEPTE